MGDKKENENDSEDWFFIGFVILVSLFWTLFVNPIAWVFRRETDRFKKLKPLRMDDLCKSLIEGKDYDLAIYGKPGERQVTERELRSVAYHISEKCALGALAEYEEINDVISSTSFWIHRNGYTEQERHKGIAIGFYLALAICGVGYWIFLS